MKGTHSNSNIFQSLKLKNLQEHNTEEHAQLVNTAVQREAKVSAMNTQQFEALKQQLQLLTPQQLKSLQGEIHQSLDVQPTDIVTDEEHSMISALFN